MSNDLVAYLLTLKLRHPTKPPQDFHDYKVHFLCENIRYTFMEPVEILRSGYKYRIGWIGQQDRNCLKRHFEGMHPDVLVFGTETEIKGSDDFNHQFRKTTFEREDFWTAHVIIYGYKTDKNFNYTPCWALDHVRPF